MKPIDQSDLQSYCRTCLDKFKSTRAAKYNIHDSAAHLKSLLVFTGLNIDDDQDSLYPQALCRRCFDTVQNFETFVTKAKETEKSLRKIVLTVDNKKCDSDSDPSLPNISNNTRDDRAEEQVDSNSMVTVHETNLLQNTRDLSEEQMISAECIKVEEIKIEDVSYDDFSQDYSIDMDNSNINALEVKFTVGDSAELDCLNISTRRTSKRNRCSNTANNTDIHENLRGISNPSKNSPIQQENEQLENKEGGFKCTFCSREFVYRKQFNKHIKRHESMELSCKICGVTRSNKSELAIHMRVHDEKIQRFQCDQCPMSLITQQSLERHVRVVHEGIRDFVCDLCPRSFSSKTHMNKHAQLHLTHPVHCEICYKRFSAESGLKVHIREYHKKQESKLICKYCQKRFITETNLREHEYAHEQPNGTKMVYTCHICDQELTTKSLLKLHMRIHDVEVSCPICSKVFPRSSSLPRHISEVHNKKFTFKCQQCSSLFNSKKNLKLHALTHLGKNPFSCEQCGKAFLSKRNLKSHMEIHTQPKFNCKLCAQHFRSEETLQKHVSIHKDLDLQI